MVRSADSFSCLLSVFQELVGEYPNYWTTLLLCLLVPWVMFLGVPGAPNTVLLGLQYSHCIFLVFVAFPSWYPWNQRDSSRKEFPRFWPIPGGSLLPARPVSLLRRPLWNGIQAENSQPARWAFPSRGIWGIIQIAGSTGQKPYLAPCLGQNWVCCLSP